MVGDSTVRRRHVWCVVASSGKQRVRCGTGALARGSDSARALVGRRRARLRAGAETVARLPCTIARSRGLLCCIVYFR